MTTFTREGVFETNSSGTHALNINPNAVRDLSQIADALQSGVLMVTISQNFAEYWERFYRPENKLAYLIVHEAMYSVFDRPDVTEEDPETLTRELRNVSCKLNDMLKAFEDVTGVRVLVQATKAEAVIDHNATGEAAFLFKDMNALVDFVLDPSCYVETGYDSSSPPEDIPTDLGHCVSYYKHHYAAPCSSGVPVSVTLGRLDREASAILPDGEEMAASTSTYAKTFLKGALEGFVIEEIEAHHGKRSPSEEDIRSDVHRMIAELQSAEISDDGPDFNAAPGIVTKPAVRMTVCPKLLKEPFGSRSRFTLKGRMPEGNLDLIREAFQEMWAENEPGGPQ